MIWQALIKGTAIVTFTQGVVALVDKVFADEVLPHRIYNTEEVAPILGMTRIDVIKLLQRDELKGKRVDGNYRILGSSILEYMSR